MYDFCTDITGDGLSTGCITHVKAQFDLKYTNVLFDEISLVYLVTNTTGWLP